MRERLSIALAAIAALLLAYNLYQMFLVLPDEAMQGAIYRILFFHAPAAMVGMIGYFVALTFSIMYLSFGDFKYDSLAASVIEVSLVFLARQHRHGQHLGAHHLGHLVDVGLPPDLGARLHPDLQRLPDAAPRHRRTDSTRPPVFGAVHLRLCRRGDRLEVDRVVPEPAPGPVLDFRTGGGHMDPAMAHVFYHELLGAPAGCHGSGADPYTSGINCARDRLAAPVGPRSLEGEILWTLEISLSCFTASRPPG